MKKALFVLAACVLAASMANTVIADEIALWFDERDSYAEIENPVPPYVNNPGGGVAGDAQIAYVSPELPYGYHEYQGFDASQGSLTLYANFTPGAGCMLASLGINVTISEPDTGGYDEIGLQSLTFTPWNAPEDVGGGLTTDAWDGYATGTWTTTGGFFNAVQVPVTDEGAGPVFDAETGVTEGIGYRLGTLSFQGAYRDFAQFVGVLDVFISVQRPLITQTNEAGTAAPLNLYLGYASDGNLELADGTGSEVGATTETPDAIIQVRMKGDFNGDGRINSLDISSFLAARAAEFGTLDREALYLGDFNGDGRVNNLDIKGFLDARALP